MPSAARLLIRGPRRRQGRVRISGAKNSAVAILPACLLAHEPCSIQNVPRIADVQVLQEILKDLGAEVGRTGDCVEVDARALDLERVPYREAKRLRASVLFLGALLARLGRARVPLPGGCQIGSRPVDLHIKGLEELGAQIVIEHGQVVATARRLRGSEIYLDFPSVSATENIMMAATAARGTTTIYNAAKEPEVVDLANFLSALGAKVVGAGTDTIKVKGGGELGGGSHAIIPDRIEAGTYLLAGLIGGGSVTVENVIPLHLEALLAKLEECGVELSESGDSIRAVLAGRCRAIQAKTLPYPGFPTDLQPQLTAFLLLGEGTSLVTERIFEDRFGHVDELNRLGGQIKMDGRTAVITGVDHLTGAPVTATDLRMGAALIIAGLAAEGETVVDGLEHVERGYEDLEAKLGALGAEVSRIEEAAEAPLPQQG